MWSSTQVIENVNNHVETSRCLLLFRFGEIIQTKLVGILLVYTSALLLIPLNWLGHTFALRLDYLWRGPRDAPVSVVGRESHSCPKLGKQ